MTSEASASARFVPVADVLLYHPAVHAQLGRDADADHVVKDGQYISYTETSFRSCDFIWRCFLGPRGPHGIPLLVS